MKRYFSMISFLIFGLVCINSQTLLLPNFALKSHPTLDITKVELSPEKSVFYLTIENRIEGGNFCADRNIFLIDSNKKKLKLSKSSGIPVCPDNYSFRSIGEKLSFVLTFPPLEKDVKCIDIKEECSDNCFSFYGVILENNLNKLIDEAFFLAENGEPAKALDQFILIADEKDAGNSGIEALLDINIIKLAKETENSSLAEEWYNRLKSSGIPGLKMYLNNLNSQGIKY
jgi:hypothetical protein